MKISDPLWALWCIIVKSRRGWCELCRLPLSCKLTLLPLSLYQGGRGDTNMRLYNCPEVIGDLMRGTWHWNVFRASKILPMQMAGKRWSMSAGLETGSSSSSEIEITVSSSTGDASRCSSFGGAGWRCGWWLMWSKRKELERYLLGLVMIYPYWIIRRQKEICGQWTLK